MDRVRKHPAIACWLIFMICATARIFKYFFIRTDESFLVENFIHKLFGVHSANSQNITSSESRTHRT